jgi:hypothetical protein
MEFVFNKEERTRCYSDGVTTPDDILHVNPLDFYKQTTLKDVLSISTNNPFPRTIEGLDKYFVERNTLETFCMEKWEGLTAKEFITCPTYESKLQVEASLVESLNGNSEVILSESQFNDLIEKVKEFKRTVLESLLDRGDILLVRSPFQYIWSVKLSKDLAKAWFVMQIRARLTSVKRRKV